MTVLSDQDIGRELAYGDLDVSPVDLDEQLQPASLDIRLGDVFGVYEFPEEKKHIDVREDDIDEFLVEKEIGEEGWFVVEPDKFYLANTKEEISIPDYLEAELMGRSSLARLGIEIHQTAGLFDPGFSDSDGVLEITNVLGKPVKLYTGMRIGQLVFKRLESRSNNPYNSDDNKYQGQKGAQASKIQQDFHDS